MSEEKSIEEYQEENAKLKAKLTTAFRELGQRNDQLNEKHKEVTDSINYAQRIQIAMMQPEYLVKERLEDSFIIYLPKDVVSGDFYYVGKKQKDTVVFGAIDCTGHGVPGALLSVIGFTFIQQAVRERGMTTPSEILTFLDDGVNRILRQTGDESGVKDGMDLALCALNTKTRVLEYAGAYNPLYYFNKGELKEIKANRSPIGVNEDGVPDEYSNHTIQLDKGDTLYLMSDGYADQFGGKHGSKYKHRRLRELIVSIQELSMGAQKERFESAFYRWKGEHDQVDDILIIGVRV